MREQDAQVCLPRRGEKQEVQHLGRQEKHEEEEQEQEVSMEKGLVC